jgi:hypothetical protein
VRCDAAWARQIPTKWKRLDLSDLTAGVAQGDIYQMMAYARLYRCPPDAALSRDRRAAGGEQRVFGLAGGTERPKNLRTVNLAATTGDGGLAPNTPSVGLSNRPLPKHPKDILVGLSASASEHQQTHGAEQSWFCGVCPAVAGTSIENQNFDVQGIIFRVLKGPNCTPCTSASNEGGIYPSRCPSPRLATT